MEVTLLAQVASWIIGMASSYPMAVTVFTVLGTLVVVMSVVAPIVVKLTTWTEVDNEIWKKISNNIFFKVLVKTLGSFSVWQPPKK